MRVTDEQMGVMLRLLKGSDDPMADALLDLRDARAEVERLRTDQQDWRKGVELIASALGTHTDNLCCVRIADIALNLRAKLAEAVEALRLIAAYQDRAATWKPIPMEYINRAARVVDAQ